jgi:hypothetical protein
LAPHVEPDGSLLVVPLPEQVVLTRTYSLGHRVTDLSALRQALPEAELKLEQQTLTVVGREEDHRYVTGWLQGPSSRPRPPTGLASKRFTLTVRNQPLDAVLQAVASQSQLQLVWPAGSESLQQSRVSTAVENATLAELLSALLQGQAATHRIQGKRLFIVLERPRQ